MSRSDLSSLSQGYSLFEVLVALGVLSLILAASVRFLDGPSPQLQHQATLSELQRTATELRLQAIQTGSQVVWEPNATACTGSATASRIVFYEDGSASGEDICVGASRLSLQHTLGRLSVVE